jgi:hypothetical protein
VHLSIHNDDKLLNYGAYYLVELSKIYITHYFVNIPPKAAPPKAAPSQVAPPKTASAKAAAPKVAAPKAAAPKPAPPKPPMAPPLCEIIIYRCQTANCQRVVNQGPNYLLKCTLKCQPKAAEVTLGICAPCQQQQDQDHQN